MDSNEAAKERGALRRRRRLRQLLGAVVCFLAVSYTHLDVYKRQVLGRAWV